MMILSFKTLGYLCERIGFITIPQGYNNDDDNLSAVYNLFYDIDSACRNEVGKIH